MSVAPELATEWIDRWDAQQEGYVPGREERFAVLADLVEATCEGTAEPVVVDLGCGPGSLTARLAARIPRARFVAIDADPVLLALARSRYGGLGTWVQADLADPGVARTLPDRIDAAVSTTALHWMRTGDLQTLYRALGARTPAGGLFANADHLPLPDDGLSGLARAVGRGRAAREPGAGGEDWRGWWDALLADPRLADVTAGRTRAGSSVQDAAGHSEDHDGSNRLSADDHARLLRDAGYASAGTVWQAGDDHVVAGVR